MPRGRCWNLPHTQCHWAGGPTPFPLRARITQDLCNQARSGPPTCRGVTGSSSARFASGSPEPGARSVWRNRAAFLFLSACSCFSLDSLLAWASFSRAAAASRSSSFSLAGGRGEKSHRGSVTGRHTGRSLRRSSPRQKYTLVARRQTSHLFLQCIWTIFTEL